MLDSKRQHSDGLAFDDFRLRPPRETVFAALARSGQRRVDGDGPLQVALTDGIRLLRAQWRMEEMSMSRVLYMKASSTVCGFCASLLRGALLACADCCASTKLCLAMLALRRPVVRRPFLRELVGEPGFGRAEDRQVVVVVKSC